mmetsp:Transcript_14005/g.19442  ORF Transcript_14005/g.19442 Transcript_14005/m.19442 type:complete len:111 (-) Transcript_14005:1361-1693(-)
MEQGQRIELEQKRNDLERGIDLGQRRSWNKELIWSKEFVWDEELNERAMKNPKSKSELKNPKLMKNQEGRRVRCWLPETSLCMVWRKCGRGAFEGLPLRESCAMQRWKHL